MPDNLTVSISADSSKLRADLALAQSKVREFGREVKKAADEARKSGDTTRLRDVSAQYEAATRQVRGLNAALGEQNKVIATGKRNWSEMAVGVKEAVAAFAGLSAVRGIANIFKNTAKEITELRNTAKAAAMTPGDVQAFQEVIKDTGESADGARQALVALTDKIAQARIKTQGFNRDLATGVNVMRGSEGAASNMVKVFRGGEGDDAFGVNVIRGGQAAAKSVEDLSKKILDNAAKFKDNKQAVQSVLVDLGKLKRQDAALGTAVGVDLLGRKYALFAEAIDRLSKGASWDEVKAQLKAQGRLIEEDGTSRAEQYNKAVDDLGDALEKLQFAIAIPLFPDVAAGITNIASLIENFDQLINKYKEFRDISGMSAIEENIAGPIRRGVTSGLDALRQFGKDIPGPIGASFTILADLIKVSVDIITGDLSGAVRDFGTLFSDVWTAVTGLVTGFGAAVRGAIGLVGDLITWVGNLASKIASLPSSLFSGTGTAAPAVPGAVYAAGGMVRGAGTGTSDSILARLSAGEFVIRAAAVRKWGAGFFAALNGTRGYAAGGLVPGFAGGGPIVKSLSDVSFLTADIQRVSENFPDVFWDLANELTQFVTGFVSQIASAAQEANGIVNQAINQLEKTGLARGGLIRGAGTGTSDSILARLSNGEFVMRAGAVQHWGAGLLSAMNMAGLPRFAAGGLVGAGASGGTPVHLHLGGQSFALSGGADVVSSLVQAARHQQIRSAGVKPSWYGGTPGGR